jgi:hypothetical protein
MRGLCVMGLVGEFMAFLLFAIPGFGCLGRRLIENLCFRGFSICRTLALQFPKKCLAVHTANPSFTAPTYRRSPVRYLKYRIAKATKAKISALSFGYTPSEVRTPPTLPTEAHHDKYSTEPLAPTLHRLYSLRPQTLAFSLCDSPVGLLAALLDVIHTRDLPLQPDTARSRSPFLSPVELEMTREQDEDEEVTESREGDGRSHTWTPTEVLNFTMLQWLPGPEAVRPPFLSL